MELTNVHDLPIPYVEAVTYDKYDRIGDISITGLTEPPRMRILKRRHDAEITEDVSERVWLLLGSSVHAMLERTNSDNHLIEERMTAKCNGWTIAGKPDLLDPDETLTDWKVTSVYSFLLGEKPEWTQQLNFYRWLYWANGFDTSKLQIIAILRDWSKGKAKRESDYPQTAIHVVEIPMRDMDEIGTQISLLVAQHRMAELLPDDQLPECTPEQRWAKATTWAVKKATNKTAFRVFDNEAQSQMLLKEKGDGWIIETRLGANVRCNDYCLAAPFCSQYQSLKKVA